MGGTSRLDVWPGTDHVTLQKKQRFNTWGSARGLWSVSQGRRLVRGAGWVRRVVTCRGWTRIVNLSAFRSIRLCSPGTRRSTSGGTRDHTRVPGGAVGFSIDAGELRRVFRGFTLLHPIYRQTIRKDPLENPLPPNEAGVAYPIGQRAMFNVIFKTCDRKETCGEVCSIENLGGFEIGFDRYVV